VVFTAEPFEADRIVVIGCTGSGKSTLAAALAARLGAPHIRRDALGREGSDQYRRAAAAAVAGDRWVFDGAPYYVEPLVYQRAGLIVGFDLARRVVMRRVLTRSLRESLGWLPAPPHRDPRWRAWLNPEHPVRWAWSTWADRHHELADLSDRALANRANVVSLSTPRGVTAWFERRTDPGWLLLLPAARV
jgi:adenylate kinase family enzyme